MKRLIAAATLIIATLASSPAMAAPTVTTTVTIPGPARAVHRSLVTTAVWRKVLKVHVCEEGNGPGAWHIDGPKYEGGLGYRWGLYEAHRPAGFPAHAWQATPQQQAFVMVRVIADVFGGVWPDQRPWPHPCTGGY